MSPRALLLGLLGLVAALAIGVGAHLVSSDSVGLANAPLQSVDSLAPPQAERPATRRKTPKRRTRRRSPQRTTPAPPVDDNGGRGGNSGPGGGGGGNSGSGGGDDD